MTLRCEYPYWTHEAWLAKSISQTGRCPTCRTSIHRLDDEIGLAKAVADGDIAAVRIGFGRGTADEPTTATDAIGIQDSSKRTVGTTYCNEGGESGYRSKVAQLAGRCAGFTRSAHV